MASSKNSTGKGSLFTLYAAGISVWMLLVACGGMTYMLPLAPAEGDANVYVIAQQLSYVATFFLVALGAGKLDKASPHMLDILAIGAFLLTDICLVAISLGQTRMSLLVAYGMAMGVGTTLGYMQWIRIVSFRESGEVLALLFIASAASIAGGFAFFFVPLGVRLVLYGAILIPVSLALMWANSATLSSVSPRRAVGRGKGDIDLRTVVRAVALPGICAVVLTLVAPLASTMLVDAQDHETLRVMIAQSANLFALLALAAVYYGARKSLDFEQLYIISLPVLATAVLLAAFVQPAMRWPVLFLSDACFCAVSFLLLLTSCELSTNLNLSTMVSYGILGGLVYLARLPEALLVVHPQARTDILAPLVVAALIYLLAIPAFLIPIAERRGWPGGNVFAAIRGRVSEQSQTADKSDEIHTDAPHVLAHSREIITHTCSKMASASGLTQRQAEVMARLVQNDSVGRIGEELGLSQSSVKTYRKIIYAAVGVHSRQELVDLVEAKIESGSTGSFPE